MNLFDLVNRPDRSVVVERGEVVAKQGHLAGASRRYVQLERKAVLRLKDAHELYSIRILNTDFGWSALSADRRGACLKVSLEPHGGRLAHILVGDFQDIGCDQPSRIEFRWPHEVVTQPGFDLVFEATGTAPVQILVGPAIDMRSYVLPYAKGRGVEVGPGLRPHVLPAPAVDVRYVEQQHPRDWLTMYNHTGEKPQMPPDDVLALYRVGSAVELETVEALSLDFIFSNHVFEHLANPLQVMANWLSRLKPGGVILGVVPDPRYTFDCRQPPTTLSEAMAEETAGGHEISRAKYVRWCQYTEPRHTPDSLIKRGYSIHVNYFTPEGFQAMADLLKERGLISRSFLAAAPNNKDFAFAFWKAGAASEPGLEAWQQRHEVA